MRAPPQLYQTPPTQENTAAALLTANYTNADISGMR